MLRTVMIVIDNVDACRSFLSNALALAERLKAHAKVMLLTPGPLASARLAPFLTLYVSEDVLRRDEADRIAALRRLLEPAECPVEVCSLHDDVAWLPGDVRRSPHLADLIVVGGIESWEVPWLRRRALETLLLSSGTPLLLLAAERTLEPVNHAVLAWKPSPAAIRALHDLIAIAAPGATIDVAIVEDGAPRVDGAEVERYLIRHGFAVSLHRLGMESGSNIASVLQAFAINRRADLLAAGGYGHSRVHEVWFGGVTQEILAETQLPVLLSH